MAKVCGVFLRSPVRYSSRVISWNVLLPSAVKSMRTLGLLFWPLKPARAPEMASPVSAGGRAKTYHCSGWLVAGSAGLTTSAYLSVLPSAASWSISAWDAPWRWSSLRASSLVATGPTGRDRGSSL